MDERGSMYVEFVLALMIFSMVILPSLSYFHLLYEQSERLTNRWEAYWLLAHAAERWLSGEPGIQPGNPEFEVQITEYETQPGITKGEIVVHWKEKNQEKAWTLYVHKMVLPFSR